MPNCSNFVQFIVGKLQKDDYPLANHFSVAVLFKVYTESFGLFAFHLPLQEMSVQNLTSM